jgi:hypothetical protein
MQVVGAKQRKLMAEMMAEMMAHLQMMAQVSEEDDRNDDFNILQQSRQSRRAGHSFTRI